MRNLEYEFLHEINCGSEIWRHPSLSIHDSMAKNVLLCSAKMGMKNLNKQHETSDISILDIYKFMYAIIFGIKLI